MRKPSKAIYAALVLIVALGCSIVAAAQIRTGGYKEVSRDNPEVEAAANFAVAEQGRKQETSFTLVSIERAESQVVAGTNYKLCLKVSTEGDDDDPKGVQAIVFRNLQKAYSLTSWEEKDCGGNDSEGNHASSTDSITSAYSSLSGCKLVTTGHDSSTQACTGVGGYNLRLEYGDARESITVISPNGHKYPLSFDQVISHGFSSVGKKAEWRVARKNGKLLPVALIVRFDASENPADSTKVTSYLVVAKITPQNVCVTDKIAPSATANEEARRAADASADKPCLEAPSENHTPLAAVSVGGVYGDFTANKISGDLDGMRVAIFAAGGAYHAIVQIAQGGAEDPKPEFVDVEVKGTTVNFTVGEQKYTGRVMAAGLKLKDEGLLRRQPCAGYFNVGP